jgi:tagaturonate reductase
MKDAPRLSRSALVAPPLELPEKAVQFGTGAFLRGFIDYFIDAANRRGMFNGRVIAIGSTGSPRERQLREQNGLFTLAIQGLERGEPKLEYRLINAVSRAISAQTEWDEVLQCARIPGLEFVFSNTTEVGIRLDDADRTRDGVPRSFPAKLTRFLHERGRSFDWSAERGVIVIPCELIEKNGTRLRELVLEQSQHWQLESEFRAWVEHYVIFCDTLVDRIVPGELNAAARAKAARILGYHDELLTSCEVYRLFAIEADAATRARLSFARAESNIILTHSVTPYRERKVRLLNGTHTIMVPIALLAGCETVRDAVSDDLVGGFVRHVLLQELVASTDVQDAEPFALEVLERFANPFIRHELVDITLQQTTKMRVRVVPAIVDYYRKHKAVPRSIAFGFAAYLLLLREGNARPDDEADRVRGAWQDSPDPRAVAAAVCSDCTLWGADLGALTGFVAEVAESLDGIIRLGARSALEAHRASSAGRTGVPA